MNQKNYPPAEKVSVAEQATSDSRFLGAVFTILASLTIGAMVWLLTEPAQAVNTASSGPTITVVQGSFNNKPTLAASADVAVSNWQYVKSSRSLDCDQDDFTSVTPGTSNYIYLYPEDDGLNFCFRAKNSSNVYGYGPFRADLNPPTISLISLDAQPGQTVITVGANEPIKSWKYQLTALTVSTCNAATGNWLTAKTGATATLKNPGAVCFAATDNADKTSYYRRQVATIKPHVTPVVTVNYDHSSRVVTASASGVSIRSWVYLTSYNSAINCQTANYTNPSGTSHRAYVAITSRDAHYCFRATSQHNQSGYGKIKVPYNQPARPIHLRYSVSQSALNASEPYNTVVSWHIYVSLDSTVNCRSLTGYSSVSGGTGRSVKIFIGPSSDSRTYCLKATNASNNASYAKLTVAATATPAPADPQPLPPAGQVITINPDQPTVTVPAQVPITTTINFSQDAHSLTASLSDNMTASSWQYLRYPGQRYPNGPDCQATNPHLSQDSYWSKYQAPTGQTVTISKNDNGYWYCFRAKTSAGVVYGKHQVQGAQDQVVLIARPRPAPKPAVTPEPVQAPASPAPARPPAPAVKTPTQEPAEPVPITPAVSPTPVIVSQPVNPTPPETDQINRPGQPLVPEDPVEDDKVESLVYGALTASLTFLGVALVIGFNNRRRPKA